MLLVLHGWADLALTLVSVCNDMSVFRSTANAGDERLVQTYSVEGILMAPSGQVHSLLCYTVFYPQFALYVTVSASACD